MLNLTGSDHCTVIATTWHIWSQQNQTTTSLYTLYTETKWEPSAD